MIRSARKLLGEAMPTVASDLEYHGYPDAMQILFNYGRYPEDYDVGSVVDPDITRHSGLRALINAHNFLLGETVEVDGAVELDANFGLTQPTVCSNAERYFMTLTSNINPDFETRFSERYYDDFLKKATVVTDESGEPVVMKKYYESESALTLKPISLSGFPIPAGTIIGLNLSGQEHGYTGFVEDEIDKQQFVQTLGGGMLRLIGVDEVEKIRPIRLSSFAGRSRLERHDLRRYKCTVRAWEMSKIGIGHINAAVSQGVRTAQPASQDLATR